MLLLLLLGCGTDDGPPPPPEDTVDTSPETPVAPYPVTVTVTLDGAPLAGALVMQGGGSTRATTDAEGVAVVTMDPTVVGDQWVVAAYPEARTGGVEVEGSAAEIALVRYDARDNPDYVFAVPGEDHETSTTAECVHCHVTARDDWYASPHRQAASNPAVQDLYLGIASALDADACAGEWGSGDVAGGTQGDRCAVGAGVLADTEGYGGCADCHAPGIDGELGGRDLREATGTAYESGVHCDVCHHVASVDLDAAPGVAGRLNLLRPSEAASAPGMGLWEPLSFGPLLDVVNPRMGAVYTPAFHEASFCAGCHEDEQEAMVGTVDATRWPDGRLPIHTTYSEWEAGPMNPSAPCQSCHMPPKPDVGNSADLYNVITDVDPGVAAGWERAPGAMRAHTWYGPRQPDSGMLQSAASVDVVTTVADGELVATVTVTNVGPGHALPTGEPLRSMLLLVEASCDGQALVATGGDVVPDFGGALDEKAAGEDWSTWPGAAVGDVVRVVRRTGAWRDYTGYGPFGDGTFSAEEKGMPVEEFVGSATITGVGESVTFDTPLPEGDVAYRVRDDAYAGAPGFGFARVLAGEDGARMVPHFLAVDVVSDNRLLPTEAWETTHRFAATCASPAVHATLIHRNYPLDLAAERGWTVTDQVMAETTR